MKTVFSSLLILTLATPVFATTLECRRDRGGTSRATIEVSGTELVSAIVRHSGIRKMATVEFNKENSRFSIGSNSSEKYLHVTRALPDIFKEASASISYKIEEKGRKLTLPESLVGAQYALNGKPYGKLRFDFTISGGFSEDYGWTYFYYCQISKP